MKPKYPSKGRVPRKVGYALIVDAERTIDFLWKQNAIVDARLEEMLQSAAQRDAAIIALADRQGQLDDAMTSLAQSMLKLAAQKKRTSERVDQMVSAAPFAAINLSGEHSANFAV